MTKKYFVYSASGADFFDTEAEAVVAAKQIIDDLRYVCNSEEWPEEVETVCVGKVLYRSKQRVDSADQSVCDYALGAVDD